MVFGLLLKATSGNYKRGGSNSHWDRTASKSVVTESPSEWHSVRYNFIARLFSQVTCLLIHIWILFFFLKGTESHRPVQAIKNKTSRYGEMVERWFCTYTPWLILLNSNPENAVWEKARSQMTVLKLKRIKGIYYLMMISALCRA